MHNLIETILGGFSSWKTTLTGLVGAIIVLLNSYSVIHITAEQQATIIAFVLLILGWVAKDNNAIGKPADDV